MSTLRAFFNGIQHFFLGIVIGGIAALIMLWPMIVGGGIMLLPRFESTQSAQVAIIFGAMVFNFGWLGILIEKL